MIAAVAGRTGAQTTLPTYELTKEGQIWQYAGYIGAGLDFEQCFGSDAARRLNADIDAECWDNLQNNPDWKKVMWEPTGFAIHEVPGDLNAYRVIIADRLNNRVQVYGWQTSLTPGTPTPDGNPIQTIESFASAFNPTLNTPESVSVDADGNVLIADSVNSRVVVLKYNATDSTYTYDFEINYATEDQIDAWHQPVPYYMALAPGTVVQDPNDPTTPACNPASPGPGRILVANTSPFWEPHDEIDPAYFNQVVVYDGKFCELSRLGTANLLGSSAAGDFNGMNGLAFDGDGRLYVGDYNNARVQAFAPANLTNPADPFTFTSFNPTPVLTVKDFLPSLLPIEPWGVLLDVMNGEDADPTNDVTRLMIAQPLRERLAVYNLDWTQPNNVAQFAFELNAKGQIQGAPHHIERDSLGRLLLSSPWLDQIDVFVTPALAVFDQTATVVNYQGDDAIRVEFSVATPLGQLTRENVMPQVAALDAGLDAPLGPFPVSNAFPEAGDTLDILPGQYARYYFLFPILDSELSIADFNVWATSTASDGTTIAATAPTKTATVRLLTCASTAPSTLLHDVVDLFDPETVLTPSESSLTNREYYGANAQIRLRATDADGVAALRYEFATSPLTEEIQGDEALIPVTPALETLTHTITFWAIDGCNTVSNPVTFDVNVDSVRPDIIAGTPLETPTGTDHANRSWWNLNSVRVPITIADKEFGGDVEVLEGNSTWRTRRNQLEGELLFTEEEESQFVRASDPVGNEGGVEVKVNIDRTPPTLTFTPPPAPASGWFTTAVSVKMSAVDWLSGVNSATLTSTGSTPVLHMPLDPNRLQIHATTVVAGEGSAVPLTGSATDYAGNNVQAATTLKIDSTAPVIADSAVGTPVLIGGQPGYRDSVAIAFAVSDLKAGVSGVSGVASVTCTVNGSNVACPIAPAPPLVFTSNTTVSVIAADVAGNVSTFTRTYLVSDEADPVCIVAQPGLSDHDVQKMRFWRKLAAEGRIGNLGMPHTYELALFEFSEAPRTTAEFAWIDNQVEPFSLSHNAGVVVFALGTGARQQVLTWNVPSHNQPKDVVINSILIRAAGDAKYGSMTLDALKLDGFPIAHTVVAPAGNEKSVTLALQGLSSETFTLTGNARMTWPDAWTGHTPRGSKVAFHISAGHLPNAQTCDTVNHPPTALDKAVTTKRNAAVPMNLLDGAADVDGDALTLIAVSDPLHGTVSQQSGGHVVYKPDHNYIGPDSFTYTVSDGHGNSVTKTVSLTVTKSNGNY